MPFLDLKLLYKVKKKLIIGARGGAETGAGGHEKDCVQESSDRREQNGRGERKLAPPSGSPEKEPDGRSEMERKRGGTGESQDKTC